MVSNYLIYLNSLPNEAKNKEILIIISFFLILFVICAFLEFLKIKFMDENKDSLFQKFLKKL